MIVKVIELVGSSNNNWTDAVENAVKEAAKTIDHILGVEVTNLTAHIDGNSISEYKANVKIAFHVH
jgi:flavin-binding protein dodecin